MATANDVKWRVNQINICASYIPSPFPPNTFPSLLTLLSFPLFPPVSHVPPCSESVANGLLVDFRFFVSLSFRPQVDLSAAPSRKSRFQPLSFDAVAMFRIAPLVALCALLVSFVAAAPAALPLPLQVCCSTCLSTRPLTCIVPPARACSQRSRSISANPGLRQTLSSGE